MRIRRKGGRRGRKEGLNYKMVRTKRKINHVKMTKFKR